MLILVLAFTALSLKIYADFLKRLAPEVQLLNELYKTTRHIESSASDSIAIVDQVFPRYANQMWTEGMIVNSADEQTYSDSVYKTQLYNPINKHLVSGDILAIDRNPNDIKPKDRARNNFRFLTSDPSRLAALQKLGVAPRCLRFCALPDGRLETKNSGSYSAQDPKRVQILAANKSISTDSQSEIPHSTLKPQPKRNVVSSTLEAEKKSTTEKLTAKQEETRRRYRSKIWELVLRYLEYPQRAQRRGQEGTVRLSVVIDRSGRIIKLVFLEQSQYHLLNQAVTRAAKRANPFPPVPEELEGGEFNFDMPFTFHVK